MYAAPPPPPQRPAGGAEAQRQPGGPDWRQLFGANPPRGRNSLTDGGWRMADDMWRMTGHQRRVSIYHLPSVVMASCNWHGTSICKVGPE